ncbi:hypothetical protein [Blautia wexlerae]|uniref:hypothetical protein n=1 Tax=Blautia wexlerae TaxID=418240 RepID=UPI00156F27CE|nr:hypothetical protein [Blautia wexlerae]MCB5710533.1 hypothetical protein [Blautia wexlerae]NSF99651.1 hypothetical protein [Blautia wexlerae]NSG10249.1 hypothetical protein [Blautia wexlerae]NSG23857.1 hypothetical protein [Blautia wexlerae]NSG37691.1 hypothetical protein [Blautia wexlerae]
MNNQLILILEFEERGCPENRQLLLYCPIYCMLFSGMIRYVLEHAEKFYENCKKIQEKKDSILNAMEKMQFLKKQLL